LRIRGFAFLALGLLTVGIAPMTGCGGGSATSVTGAVTTSPFAGEYSGPFSTSDGQQGTVTGSISTDGRVTGTVNNTTYNLQGTVVGTVSNSGSADITFTYASGGARGTGPITLDNGTIKGTLTQIVSGQAAGTVTISLARVVD
jgi:hypothetical protein